jgi:hypothetical protein
MSLVTHNLLKLVTRNSAYRPTLYLVCSNRCSLMTQSSTLYKLDLKNHTNIGVYALARKYTCTAHMHAHLCCIDCAYAVRTGAH